MRVPIPVLATADLPPMFSLIALMLVGVVAVSLILLRLRQSLLVGYFLCGIAISNTGLLDILAGEDATLAIKRVSEFGVMLLLFVIGMEFSLAELKHLRRYAFRGGTAQIAITVATAGAATWAYFGFPWTLIAVVAVACAMSSTAISIKLYHDMRVAASSGARLALGIAILQDLFVIAFLVVLPALFGDAGAAHPMGPQLLLTVVQGALFILAAVLLARYVIPHVLHAVSQTRSRELFTLTVAGLCIGVAYLAALMNLSLMLGAFVAGVAVSECMYKHRIMSEVGPFKDLFLTLFFVSVGLGIDLKEVASEWVLVISITALLLVGKSVLVGAIARLLGLSWRAATLAGIGLGSAGEFSLVLIGKASQLTNWPESANQPLLAAMALSMAMVPVLMLQAPRIWTWLEKHHPALLQRKRPRESVAAQSEKFTNHAIVCGYGPVGETLVNALSEQAIQTVVIDLNADTIRQLHSEGQTALFADASQPDVWDLVNVSEARLVAFTFPATSAVSSAMHLVRERNHAITIIARTAFSSEAASLADAGANIVLQDEVETSRAVVDRALGALELKIPIKQDGRTASP